MLHRRIPFWLGLLILIFITWAWHTSYRYEAGISSGSVLEFTSVASTSGVIAVHRVRDLTGTGLPAGPRRRGISTFSRELDRVDPWHPSLQPIHFEETTDEPTLYRSSDLTIAWWFITLLHLIAWSATLTWLHRRQRKLLDSLPK